MITKEQREKHYIRDELNLQYARLTQDYKAPGLDYVLPAGTIVQLDLYPGDEPFDLYVGVFLVDINFPYDAAELLE